jgi:preprotein translocase subunit YajC
MMTDLFNSMMLFAAEAGGQAAGEGGEQPGITDALLQFAPIILIVIALFWFMNRSQRKREQERQEMLDRVQPKDDVMTVGGIRGRVVRVEDDEVVVRIDPEKDVKVRMAKTGIASRLEEQEQQG